MVIGNRRCGGGQLSSQVMVGVCFLHISDLSGTEGTAEPVFHKQVFHILPIIYLGNMQFSLGCISSCPYPKGSSASRNSQVFMLLVSLLSPCLYALSHLSATPPHPRPGLPRSHFSFAWSLTLTPFWDDGQGGCPLQIPKPRHPIDLTHVSRQSTDLLT